MTKNVAVNAWNAFSISKMTRAKCPVSGINKCYLETESVNRL
jgi:hypothetical protein